jgi:hypothetical protein
MKASTQPERLVLPCTKYCRKIVTAGSGSGSGITAVEFILVV